MSHIGARRSERISESKINGDDGKKHGEMTRRAKMNVVVFIDQFGRDAISASKYRYMCHGCGSPDELIVGTLNKGNRLALWCATCYLIPIDEAMNGCVPTEAAMMNHSSFFGRQPAKRVQSLPHFPIQISNEMTQFVRDWPPENDSRDLERARHLRIVSKSTRNWLLQDMSLHQPSLRTPYCSGACSGCQDVQENLKIWLPEVVGWYDRFGYQEGDGDWWQREGKKCIVKH